MRPVGTGPEPETRPEVITTERLVLRPPAAEDAVPLFDLIYGNDAITSQILWDGPKEVSDYDSWCAKYAANDFYDGGHHWVITLAREPRQPIGAAGIRGEHQPGQADMGYWLGQQYWGQGYMSAAVQAIVGYGFETLNLHRIEAGAYVTNAASSAVLRNAGLVEEGIRRGTLFKGGAWLDERVAVILRPEWEAQRTGSSR